MALEEAFLPSGEDSSAPAPRPILEQSMDVVERTYRGYVKVARKRGWNLAADFLEHYLDGKGGRVNLSREQARAFKPIAEAENRIKRYFEESFQEKISGEEHKFLKPLKGMRDGQDPLKFKDFWEDKFDFEKWQPFADGALALKEHREAGDFGFGTAWSQNFQAKIRITGDKLTPLEFKWMDKDRAQQPRPQAARAWA